MRSDRLSPRRASRLAGETADQVPGITDEDHPGSTLTPLGCADVPRPRAPGHTRGASFRPPRFVAGSRAPLERGLCGAAARAIATPVAPGSHRALRADVRRDGRPREHTGITRMPLGAAALVVLAWVVPPTCARCRRT